MDKLTRYTNKIKGAEEFLHDEYKILSVFLAVMSLIIFVRKKKILNYAEDFFEKIILIYIHF